MAELSRTGHLPAIHRFIGLRGEGSKFAREFIANVVYEARPQPKDHKLPSKDGVPSLLH